MVISFLFICVQYITFTLQSLFLLFLVNQYMIQYTLALMISQRVSNYSHRNKSVQYYSNVNNPV